MRFLQKSLLGLALMAVLAGQLGAENLKTKSKPGAEAALVKVNGVAIPSQLLEQAVRQAVAQGQSDTPELRAALKTELVARELFTQEALHRGLDKKPNAQDALRALRQNLLIELLISDELDKKPVTEAEMQAEYDRQVKALAEVKDLKQYQLKVVVLKTEADAQGVIAAARSGRAFEELAKEKSIDPSQQNGGSLGWLLPGQVVPAIANVMVNLDKGAVSQAPIQTQGGWNVIKLEDSRPFVPPTFEESKPQLRAALLQSRRMALLKSLSATAKLD